jgi:hypothetical protein
MSQDGVKAVVARILNDDDFRLALFKDAEAVISAGSFDVSETEMAAFKQLTEEDFSELSLEELEERLSKVRLMSFVIGTPA